MSDRNPGTPTMLGLAVAMAAYQGWLVWLAWAWWAVPLGAVPLPYGAAVGLTFMFTYLTSSTTAMLLTRQQILVGEITLALGAGLGLWVLGLVA